ncbi:MAG TPA: MltA domain-containing protein [bacterium]|nr:MltA domain-containing protein [bacterium]
MKIAAAPEARKHASTARTLRPVLWALVCVLLASCASPRGLVMLKAPPTVSWQDDGSALELTRAIDQSIAYYRKLPPETTFHYGSLVYTPDELIGSLELFRSDYLAAPDPETLERRLAEHFHVFDSVREEGDNLFTGYYEPQLNASETPTAELDTPLYALPSDIVKVQLSRFGSGLPQVTLMGRVQGGELVPYFTRKEIQANGALQARAQPIAYVDPIELFFLQIQGSGVLHFPDGRQVQVGYAASNGQPYRSIGALLVRNDAMPLEQVSLQSIRTWLHDHPDQQRQVLFSNPSYVFFQVRDEGPLGNLRVPLTPGRSLAADQRVIPAGGLAYVDTEVPVPGSQTEQQSVQRFMLVQDTGGAIRGSGRADLFWGAGKDAEWIAGHQRSTGRLLLLVAKKQYLPPPPATVDAGTSGPAASAAASSR